MKNLNAYLLTGLIFLSQLSGPMALAAVSDVAVGNLNISGNVPVIFSLTTRGIPGDLDLTPGSSVHSRLLGILHFKYNVDIATLVIKSSTASGGPELGGAGAHSVFGTAFQVLVGAGCATVKNTYNALFTLNNVAGTDIKDGTALTTGIEEDCDLSATWGGPAAGTLPLAGEYSMNITLTMTSI
jgi:hypothetical protein